MKRWILIIFHNLGWYRGLFGAGTKLVLDEKNCGINIELLFPQFLFCFGLLGLFSFWILAVYFLKFTAIKANANSFSTFDFPLTENRVNDKLAFKNPKTGSTSILRFL